ncbi:MAG: hypothetical protein AB8G26_15160 [Ilumatobacter sp.]
MSRLCERPGCSDVATLAYGMRTEDLVFWIDVLQDDVDHATGVLCLRHGDSMVVPRGWTLDDLRDPDLHLFRPPPPTDSGPAPSRRRRRADDDGEQLALTGVEASPAPTPTPPAPLPPPEPSPSPPSPPEAVGASPSPGESNAEGWRPSFDADDDLDGLLAARSPLLSRAFRGTDRD